MEELAQIYQENEEFTQIYSKIDENSAHLLSLYCAQATILRGANDITESIDMHRSGLVLCNVYRKPLDDDIKMMARNMIKSLEHHFVENPNSILDIHTHYIRDTGIETKKCSKCDTFKVIESDEKDPYCYCCQSKNFVKSGHFYEISTN